MASTTTKDLMYQAQRELARAINKLDRISLGIEGAAISLGANKPADSTTDESKKLVKVLDRTDEMLMKARSSARDAERLLGLMYEDPTMMNHMKAFVDNQYDTYATQAAWETE